MSTKIEWTNETWNPVIGCDKISPGCDNCYAERMAARLANMGQTETYGNVVTWGNSETPPEFSLANGQWCGKTHFVESALNKPLHWKKPRMIFVCSMGDLFHESVPFEWIDKVMTVIASCPQHTFQVLTKRPNRMKEWFEYKDHLWKNEGMKGPERIRYLAWHNYGKMIEHEEFWPLQNLWLGVTAEDQKRADERIPILLQIPAVKRFLSIEPMLGAIDLLKEYPVGKGSVTYGALLDWIICGGETGPGARPIHPDWVRSLRDQCIETNTPFFFKSWGEWYTKWKTLTTGEPVFKMYSSYLQFTQKLWVNKGDYCIDIKGKSCKIGGDFKNAAYPVAIMSKVRKKESGHLIDGKEWREMP
jgi:protein gp37